MSLEKTVIDNIKRIRKEKGMTQEQLAEACDTATSYIGLMEIYKNVPKLSTIERIANALEVEPHILFQKNEKDAMTERKIKTIKTNVMQSVETALIRSLREQFAQQS